MDNKVKFIASAVPVVVFWIICFGIEALSGVPATVFFFTGFVGWFFFRIADIVDEENDFSISRELAEWWRNR